MHIFQNETEPIRIVAMNDTGTGVTGATVTLVIRRNDDGYYWNGGAFQSGAASVSMSETDATNLAGHYHYAWDTTDQAVGRYQMFASCASAGVVNSPWCGDLVIDQAVADAVIAQHLGAGTLGAYINTMKKYIANSLTVTGIDYSIKEDDGVTQFASGTLTTTGRTPA